jgi:hypothetical protein
LGKIVFLSYLLCLAFFLVFSLRNPKKELWIIFIYIIFSFLSDVIQSKFLGEKYAFLGSSLFTIVELIIISYYFFTVIQTPLLKKCILAASSIISLYLFVIFIQSDKKNFDSFSASLESITFIIFCLLYFYEQINKQDQFFIYSSPNFFIVLGIMIYMSGTLFLFVMANNFSEIERNKYWVINDVSNIITNISFSIAFWQNRISTQNRMTEKPYTG